MDRRKFFRTSVLGSVGAVLAPLLPKSKILATITAGESRVITLAPVCDLCGKVGHKSRVIQEPPKFMYGCGGDMGLGHGSGATYTRVCENIPSFRHPKQVSFLEEEDSRPVERVSTRKMRIPPKLARPYPSDN